MNILEKITRATLCSLAFFITINASADVVYPDRPLRWVVGYPPGGGSDNLSRIVAVQFSKELRQPVHIDNRPGASGIIASQFVAKSPADGYTILDAGNGSLINNAELYQKIPYDPQASFALVGQMARTGLLIIASPGSGISNARSLLDLLKSSPGKINIATPGKGTPHHLGLELFQSEVSASMVHVPYKGGAPAMQDIMGNQIPLMVVDVPSGLTAIKAGKVIPILALSADRIPQLPDVPTSAELGYNAVNAYSWHGIVAPAGTPKNVMEQLERNLNSSLKDEKTRKLLYEAGWDVQFLGASDWRGYIDLERKKWSALIREKNIKIDQ